MNLLNFAFVFLLVASTCLAQEKPTSPPTQGSTAQGSIAQGSAETPASNGQWNRNGVLGKITAISDTSVTLKTPENQDIQVTLTAKTQYSKDRQPVKLSDFKVGDMAFVRGKSTGPNAWEAETLSTRSGAGPDFREGLGKKFIAGEIKSIDGTNLVIARPDGVTQTIRVDEDTSFKKKGESVTLSDFVVGDHVFGRGAMKGDVFVPAVLNIGDPGMMRNRDAGDRPGDQSH